MITLITQRSEEFKHRNIDYLEQTYSNYFGKLGFILIPVPNNLDFLDSYLKLPIDRIILTGGGNIGDNISEDRDKIEKKLIEFGIENKIPLLGLCRGMQMINKFFGGDIIDIPYKKHIAKNHSVIITNNEIAGFLKKEFETNSFHDKGLKTENVSPKLNVFAKSSDNIVEGISHPSFPIAGIQWHPEREGPSKDINEKIIKSFLNKELFWEK